MAGTSYPDDLQNLLDLTEEVPGVSRRKIGIDLGLYFPMQSSSILGFAITGIGDRLEKDSDHIQLNQYLYAASYRYYLSKMVGKGLFLRGDLGLAKLVMDITGAGSEASDSGMGFIVGIGYSFQIGGGTWLSINADYTSKSIEDETVGGTTVGAAFLF